MVVQLFSGMLCRPFCEGCGRDELFAAKAAKPWGFWRVFGTKCVICFLFITMCVTRATCDSIDSSFFRLTRAFRDTASVVTRVILVAVQGKGQSTGVQL